MRKLLLPITLLALAGCETNSDDGLHEEDVRTVIDHAYASMVLDGAYPLMRALRPGNVPWADLASRTCATVDSLVGDTTDFPNNGSVTVYLSYAGCDDVDGRSRNGSLRVTFLTPMGADPGGFSAYATDLTVTGMRMRFAMHGVAVGAIQEVTVDSAFVRRENTWARMMDATLSYTMTEGGTTPAANDDEYLLTKSVSGTDIQGRTYTSYTSEGLVVGTNCRWPTRGKEIILPQGLGQRILAYGDGTCDGQTSINVGNQEIGLTIP